MLLLDVKKLSISFAPHHHSVVQDFSLSINPGEKIGLVGESGSGKSVIGKTLMGLLPKNGLYQAEKFYFENINLRQAPQKVFHKIRGKKAGLIFQNPHGALDPALPVGVQISEGLQYHFRLTRQDAKAETCRWIERVRLKPTNVFNAYPHELSGGMAQRINIACVLSLQPAFIIADEITASLDKENGLHVLKLMDTLQQELGSATLFISHDLSLIEKFCDRVIVLYKGMIQEVCAAKELKNSQHPYTKGLYYTHPAHNKGKERLPTLDRSLFT